MRKLLISLLLASAVATPAMAARGDQDRDEARQERQQDREERQQAREERQAREVNDDRQQRVERQQNVDRQQNVQRQQTYDRARSQPVDHGVRAQVFERRDNNMEARRVRTDTQQQAAEVRRQRVLRDRAEARQDRIETQGRRTLVVSNTPRPGTQPPLRVDSRRSSSPHWSTNWRHDGKYDWRNHRNRHRSLFHLGFYYDPFGWNYNPFQIGWRMWPSYYSSRYWINDPWMYRLPYAPAGYRWVRYWDDAVLVDTWSGQVVDVIYNFFW